MDDIQAAINGVMELRPSVSSSSSRSKDRQSTSCLLERRRDIDFKREIESIENGELSSAGAYFFSNSDKSKGGSKNPSFNPYHGLSIAKK
ncbi:hypothetical protein [Vibrio cholerae]|uniref:hypothetical protein n=1 Tax=Vibrio cholerae TaxID=666 RepID=UPI000AD4D722|nr:hypothetical protein [Vibrio cholerae]MDX5049772.1 hypothetical protein [Vibrio cholerae]MEB5526761.1 hypothetical protein [Vibrio cholerae]TXY77855.1 hypothetical protein FXE80_00445 [Vibrio cholerae]GIB16240.1 hypothetical protein VCSRO90_2669 [Vibrio cholerae]HDI3137134.1 hypothetical protein [Vibrio cholerae]